MKLFNSPFAVAILLAALLLLAYGHTFNFPFQFDDYNVIVDEPKVHSLSAWWQSMPGMRPLLKLSYALNWQLDNNSVYFRGFNWLAHLLTSCLAWLLSLKLLAKLSPTTPYPQAIALLAAVLFALHPAHTEVVSYICSRSSGLMGLFSLSAIVCALYAMEAKSTAKYFAAAVAVLFLCALATKETALILLVILMIINIFYKNIDEDFPVKYTIKACLIFVALFIISCALLMQIPRYAQLMEQFVQPVDIHAILLNQGIAHAYYLSHILLGRNLNVDYQLAVPTHFNVQISLIWFVIFSLLAFAWLVRKTKPLISLCITWWLVWLLPTNSILSRLDLINDRQIYMASFGAILLVSIMVFAAAKRLQKIGLFWLIPVALTSYCLVMTHLRNWDYETEITLWHASVDQAPQNARAWNNLGYAYMLDKQNEKAMNAFENALKLDDTNYKAYYNLQQLKQE